MHHAWSFRQAPGLFRKAFIALVRPLFYVQRQYNAAMARAVLQLEQRVHVLETQLRPKMYLNPDHDKVVYSPPGEGFNYFDFERLFHAPREQSRRKQSHYVELLRGRQAVVDVGCGRGELLELLQQAGIPARGIDSDPRNVEECRARGLEVLAGDFRECLAALPDGSLDAVISVQFIEHLPLEALDACFKLACRKLAPGGLFIAETVNPYHLAQFHFFHVDPTHQQPIFPELATFLARSAGFGEARINYIPCDGAPASGRQEPWDYCDYAVIARK